MTVYIHLCPNCYSDKVYTQHHQSFMLNSGEHYVHAMKTHDTNSPAGCIECKWNGIKEDLLRGGYDNNI